MSEQLETGGGRPVTVLLAAPDDQVRAWYGALAGDARFRVLGYAGRGEGLAERAQRTAPEALVVDAGLFAGPEALREALAGVSAGVYVLLPAEADEAALTAVRGIPAVRCGWRGPVDPAEGAARVYAGALETRALATRREGARAPATRREGMRGAGEWASVEAPMGVPEPPAGERAPAPVPRPCGSNSGPGRVLAFWSGPAGGTGRTALALSLGTLAAERGVDVGLLAFSEPAVVAYLRLPRVPNVTTFLGGGYDLAAAEQWVTWERDGGGEATLAVLLGPARARDGVVGREEIAQVVRAARAVHGLVLIDLPPLVPGGNAWVLEPLCQASDVVLVMGPTTASAAAAVTALGVLRDLRTAARVHVVLNRRVEGGLSTRDFAAAVAQAWDGCPDVAEVDFVAGLAGLLDRGELPGGGKLARALEPLAQIAHLPQEGPGRPSKRRRSGERDGAIRVGRVTVRLT